VAIGRCASHNHHISVPHHSISIYFSRTPHHRNSTCTCSPRQYLSNELSYVEIGPAFPYELMYLCQQTTFDIQLLSISTWIVLQYVSPAVQGNPLVIQTPLARVVTTGSIRQFVSVILLIFATFFSPLKKLHTARWYVLAVWFSVSMTRQRKLFYFSYSTPCFGTPST
jgi:hypothetical protein